jgi:hypothetical protein
MKRKVGKEPEGACKKRKDVGNDNFLASMFTKQQAVSALKNARDAYNVQLQEKRNGVGRRSVGRACAPVRKGHT